MQDDVIIKVSGLSKEFKLPHEKTTSLKSAFISFYKPKLYERQRALKDVSFEVKKGEFYGIVGRNGSGKSTLLKTLAGVYVPTAGHVEVRGKLTPFIELGVGFNPELTGRENVFLNGALLGFNRNEMRAMYKDIVEFAELERFMDQKLKNYSSGMQVRLAFSIAIRSESDILLIDEVLAVGDASFQKKSIRVIEDLKNEGRTIIFVTHSMDQVRTFCDRIAVVDNGIKIFDGDVEKGIDLYNKLNQENEKKELETQVIDGIEHLGSGGAKITSYNLYDKNAKKTKLLKSGEMFSIKVEIEYKQAVNNPVIGIIFRKNPLENLYGINNYFQGINFGAKQPGQKSVVEVADKMPLNPGDYFLTISISDARTASDYEELDLLNNFFRVSVVSDKPGWGLVKNKANIKES